MSKTLDKYKRKIEQATFETSEEIKADRDEVIYSDVAINFLKDFAKEQEQEFIDMINKTLKIWKYGHSNSEAFDDLKNELLDQLKK